MPRLTLGVGRRVMPSLQQCDSLRRILKRPRLLVGSSEVAAACRSLRREDVIIKVRPCLQWCEEELYRSCLPYWHSMAWLSPGSQAGAAAQAARESLIQRRIDELLGAVHAARRSRWLGIEDVLKAPLVLCPLGGLPWPAIPATASAGGHSMGTGKQDAVDHGNLAGREPSKRTTGDEATDV